MSLGRLAGRVAIVTGAASGFGKGIATKFANEGAHVIVADVAEEAGQSVATAVGGVFACADVTKRDSWEALRTLALDRYGRIDVVVNNAGATYVSRPSEKVTEAEFDLVFGVNVKSVYQSTAALLGPYFLKEGRPGCFIQIASTAGIRPRGNLSWYSSSKGAVITITKALASEYASRQIRFNSVSPVFAVTGLAPKFLGAEPSPESMKRFIDSIPMGRPAEPADVANACCYLASDEASFITGVNLEVDGGRCV